jgi:redox-regulated HSP33 family molecular chaperone
MDRVEAALKLLGVDEIREVAGEGTGDGAVVVCGFCRKTYAVSPKTLSELINEVEVESSELGNKK